MYISKEDFPIDIEHQSIETPDSGGARQSTLGPLGVTLEYLYDDAKTYVEAIQRGCDVSKNGKCLGWRDPNSDYKWLSYEEVIARSKNISNGLVLAGMKKGQDSNVAIFSRNSVECVLVELACSLQSAVFVQLYNTLGPSACNFILNHVEAEFLICDTVQKAKSIIDVKDSIPKLHHVVVMEEVDEALKKLAAAKGVTIHRLKDIEESGKQKQQSLLIPSPDDLVTICFTSGTTGNPKGVMMTHRNLLVAISAFCRNLGPNYITSKDVYISYLPMAHLFDRLAQLLAYINGGSVGFFMGDMNLLLEDIGKLKPTIMPAVPRILNKIFDKVQNMVQQSTLKTLLFSTALWAKESEMKRGIIRNNSLWDYLVFKKVRNTFGGQTRLLITGAAPIRKEVLMFYKCALGCAVVEGYGQTECGGVSNSTVIGDYTAGTVGPPLSSVFIKLLDVPEMEYYARNGEGEVLIKGPSVTKGYYKDPVKTAEILDGDGWLHTGDIGRWVENGCLAIVDRKKHLTKLSQGEYISPEKVESVYLRSSYVEQIFVHGDSVENFLVAIVCPDKESVMSWCTQKQIQGTWNTICENEAVKKNILKDMLELGKADGLNGLEQVRAIHLHPEGFSLENGIFTPTMKVKREECKRRFKDVIQKLYEDSRGKN